MTVSVKGELTITDGVASEPMYAPAPVPVQESNLYCVPPSTGIVVTVAKLAIEPESYQP